MGSQDAVDLALVTTYVPVVFVILRALALLLVHHVLTLCDLEYNVMIYIVAFIVFADYHLLVYDAKFDSACGHLCAVALAIVVYAPSKDPCVLPRTAVYWSIDMFWAASAALQTAAAALRVAPSAAYKHTMAKTCVWGACGIIHVTAACGGRSLFEWSARFVGYFALCSQIYFSKEVLESVDRNQHTFMTPHLSMHVLFTHAYVSISSFVIFSCLHAYVFVWTSTSSKCNTVNTADTSSWYNSREFWRRNVSENQNTHQDIQNEEFLLQQLRNAQAAKVV